MQSVVPVVADVVLDGWRAAYHCVTSSCFPDSKQINIAVFVVWSACLAMSQRREADAGWVQREGGVVNAYPCTPDLNNHAKTNHYCVACDFELDCSN